MNFCIFLIKIYCECVIVLLLPSFRLLENTLRFHAPFLKFYCCKYRAC